MPNKSLYIASSPLFIIIASILYCSMGVALWIANIYWWVVAFSVLLLGMDLRRVICLHGLRQHTNSVSILFHDCDKWQYQLKSGKLYKGTLVTQRSFCSSFIIILYMQHLRGSRYIIIPKDALSAHNFRLLAFKLKC